MTGAAGAIAEWGATDRLLARATTLAGAWGARARTSTTAGCERALLRLFGVAGLDRSGRPLAGEVVARYLAGGASRLAGGVVLPFAAALIEYDLAPQALAHSEEMRRLSGPGPWDRMMMRSKGGWRHCR